MARCAPTANQRHCAMPALPMPRVGLGTFRAKGHDVQQAVLEALECGLRHIDTASIYKNEADIAAALARASVPREQVFLTSKLSPYEQGEDKAQQACEGVLSRLGTPYVDLVLVHWPGVAKVELQSPLNAQRRRETWRVLEAFHGEGRFRAIGVSNYEVAHLQELLSYARVRPAVNQVEFHPRWQQEELRAFCEQEGIGLVAYASLGCGELLQEPTVVHVAEEAGCTPAQALLAWGLQKGAAAVIPKSVHPEYIRQYAPEVLLGLRLSKEQMEALGGLGASPHKYCWDPSGVL